MRLPLTFSTAVAAIAVAVLPAPAYAHGGPDHDDHLRPAPRAMMGHDLPPPPMPMHDYDRDDGPGWDHGPPPMHGAPMSHCGPHHGPPPAACHPQPMPYGYGHMGYAVPMIMVPVWRPKPCPEKVVEEWIEEPVRVRRRYIAPRRHVVPDKRVRIVPDKRLPMDKRQPY